MSTLEIDSSVLKHTLELVVKIPLELQRREIPQESLGMPEETPSKAKQDKCHKRAISSDPASVEARIPQKVTFKNRD